VLPTYAGLERADAADVVVVDTRATGARGALVFLHGFGGNFELPCWQIAQAAAEASLVTYCPSVGPEGHWWTDQGERTLRRTLEMVHARGFDRVYLAGLSNGGIGATRLAARMRGEFRGLVLVSGADAAAPSPGIPVLAIHGTADPMTSAASARAYAARAGGTFVALDGGHFAFLLHEAEARRAIASWLSLVGPASQAVR
jgi:pimeloyl-ACP methyl ester carboxylesterase